MSPKRLLQHFDQIAEASDAVPRLRRFILDLAVRGKLVEQNPADEPASEQLRRIEAEKKQLVKVNKILKEKPLSPIEEAEIPFDTPQNWSWTRLRNVASYIQRGKSPQYAGGEGRPVISQKCVQWDGLHLEWAKAITPESLESYEAIRFLRDGDLLWNSTGTGTIGRVVRVGQSDEGLVCDSHVTVVRCLRVDERFICIWLRSDHVYGTIEERAAGATNQVELTAGIANNQITPIPPLPEQHRIVAKVDELMALCDELEAAQQKRERRRDRLVAAALNALNNGEVGPATGSHPTFEESARFYFKHLPRLTTRPEHIQQLRQTILNLAVRGKLVPQDPKEEPVAALLERIDQERVITAKTDRRAEAGMQQLFAGDLCWGVPPTWGWRSLADLALFIDYRGKTPSKTSSGIRLITAKNVRRGFINLEPEEFITKATYDSWMTRGLPQDGDILFSTEAPMGNAAVVRLREKFGLAQRVINFRLYGGVDSDFLVLQLLSAPFQEILDKTGTGLTAKGIKAAKLKRLPIAVPPLAEQHRIVAKVDELLAISDDLESHLTSTATTRRQFLEATLSEAIAL
jgi:type I restriction enzyme S subunit